MPDLAVALPTDVNNRRFNSVQRKIPAGHVVGATDFAITDVLLVDVNAAPLVVAVDLDSGAGTANRMGVALLVPAAGGPAVVPGDATDGLKVQIGGSGVVPISDNGGSVTVDALAATAVDAGDETATDEAIVGAAAGTRLVGFSARETTAAAGAVFNIRHGTSNAGAILVTVSLGANESAREWYGPDGIAAASGLWLERVSGQTQVVGYWKVVV